ncbi:helix-turn-helix domain-containing protein [bacterium]|nr:helix-turn-helix domain-containing protein [bacterium]
MDTGLGERLARLRRERDFTLDTAATRIGISGAYLSLLERGLRLHPSEEVVGRICRLYSVAPEEVWGQPLGSPLVDDPALGHQPTVGAIVPPRPEPVVTLPVPVAEFLAGPDADFLRPSADEVRVLAAWSRHRPDATAEEVMLFLVDRLRPGLPS